MKNINKLKRCTGKDIVELIERLKSIEPNRPREIFFIDFQVQVKTDYGAWVFDSSNSANEHRIHGSHDSVANEGYDWREAVYKYLAHIDMDFAYDWEEFCVKTKRHANLYMIDVFLRRKSGIGKNVT